ncbi:MAG: TssN family type VI secretion system protein [Chitinophagaceae bacterium]
MATGYKVQNMVPFSNFTRMLWENRKIAAVNTLFFLLLSLFVATVPVTQGTGHISLGAKAFQVLAFFGLGLLSTSLLEKYQRLVNRDFSKEKWLYTLLLASLIFLILLLFYYAVNDNILVMAYASTSSFLLPLTIQQAWYFFKNIPEKQYKLWYYPSELTEIQVPKFRNGIQVQFKLPRRYFDIEEALIEAKAPEPMILSKRFHLVVFEQNSEGETVIEYLDNNRKPFGWKFYLELYGGLFRKRLDPDLSFMQNNVPKNAIIVAKRERVNETGIKGDQYAVPVNNN